MKKENMINDREKKIVEIAKSNLREEYGITLLDKKVIEEIGEFLQVFLKLERTEDHWIEELADVIIVLRQLIFTLDDDTTEKLDSMIEFKLDRTLQRKNISEE